jgi:hypothetical protein
MLRLVSVEEFHNRPRFPEILVRLETLVGVHIDPAQISQPENSSLTIAQRGNPIDEAACNKGRGWICLPAAL